MSRFNSLEFGPLAPKERIVSPEAKDERFHLSEAQAAMDAGRFADALRSFSRVLEFNPQSPRAWHGQVWMLIELNELNQAKHWADKAIEMLPGQPDLLAAHAMILSRQGDLQASLIYSDESLRSGRATTFAWLARADILLAKEEPNSGYCIEKAMELSEHPWQDWLFVSRIFFYHQQFSPASNAVQKALSLEAGKGSIWLHLARCQLMLGLTDRAAKSLREAKNLDPSSLEVAAQFQNLEDQRGIPGLLRRCKHWFSRA